MSSRVILAPGVRQVCTDCGHVLTTFCPACRGRRGGQQSSPKKTRAVRKNARRKRTRKPP
jgi:uncharacterized Zn finger protein (UPF0148 family)